MHSKGLFRFQLLGVVLAFSAIGFYASLFLGIAWLIAPIVGWIFWQEIRRPALLAALALGLFLGGLPLWSIFASTFESWPIRLLLIVSVPLCLLAGALVKQIHLISRRKDILFISAC
jgi:hypothetical protein